MKQRIFALVLTLCLAVSLLPGTALAAEPASGTCGKDLTWTLDADGTLTIQGTGRMDNYGHYADARHDAPWEKQREEIRTVVIRSGVTSIGWNAFAECAALTQVSIPRGVTSIGWNAFRECTGLTAVTIPEGCVSLGESAFFGCTALADLQMPDSVTDIGEWALHDCAMKTLILPKNLNRIGKFAFTKGKATAVVIPAGVTGFENRSFSSYDLWADIYYGGSREEWKSSGGEECIGKTLEKATVHFHSQGPFTDVSFRDWYGQDVADAAKVGILQGNGDGSFAPDGTLTLAEAITMACRVHARTAGVTIPAGGSPWYKPYLDYAQQAGICQPDGFGTAYSQPCDRLTMAKLFAEVLPKDTEKELNRVTVLPDVAATAENEPVFYLYRQGVLTGNDPYGTFCPDTAITRAETAVILNRVLDPAQRQTFTLEQQPV